MTPTGKPDDDHEAERPESERPTPPPPRWLDEQEPPAGPLLPEGGGPVQEGPRQDPSEPAVGDVEDDASDDDANTGANDDAEAAMADRTIMEFRFEQDRARPVAPPAAAPAAAPPATSTDIPAPPPFPYAQQIPAPPQPQLPAPRPPASPPPPAAQPQPAQSPPAREPFPYAQEIPGPAVPPAAASAAPPPAVPAPPAPEPFPYAQEVPGAPSTPPAAEPFPWAQQVPGGPRPAHEAAHPAAPPPPVVDEPWRTAQSKPRKPRRSLKKPLLIGTAGLAVAALVAAGVFLVPGLLGDDEGGGESGAKLAGALFPVNGAARTDGRDQQFTGVAAAGSTVVAVGSETGVGVSRGLFAVSADGGRTFTSATTREPESGGPATAALPQAVGGGSQGWVAIGSGKGTGAVWTSPDGRSWTRQPDAVGRVFGPGSQVNQIVATAGGFIAIGAKSAKPDQSDAEAALWTSADGRQWEARIGDQIGLEVKKASYSLVEAAASGDTIVLKALIKPDNKKPPQYRKVWRSQDGGRTWAVSEVPVPKGSRGLAVGGGSAGFLAVREMKKDDDFYGQAFVSKDGKTWREAGKLEMAGYNHTAQILGDAKGFTAVVAGGGNTILAQSADGATWKPAGTLPGKPGSSVAGAAPAEGQTVLVGRQPGGGDLNPLLSVFDSAGRAVPVDPAKIPGLIRPDHTVQAVGASGSLAVAVGSASGDAAVWTSADGASWKAAQGLGAAFTRPGPQQLLDVTGGKSGWLAVGYDQSAPKHPLVVTSADGATWQAADSGAAFQDGKRGALITNAAAAGAAGYVVVGTEGPSAATWSSTDLKTWKRGAGADATVLEGKPNAGRWMLDVASAGSGFTAVGGVRDAKGNHPAVWSSPDGLRWTVKTLPLPSSVIEGHLTHVAAKGGTLVAAGIASSKEGADWIGYVSADGGSTWRELPVPGGDRHIVTTALAATPSGFAATATAGTAGSTDVVSMTSRDGSAWTAAKPGGTGLGGDGDQRVTGLAPLGGRVLGVGRSADAETEQPVLWTRAG